MMKQRSRGSGSNPKTENGKEKKSIDTAIVTALIGLIGTIVAAFIGLFAIRSQMEIPIRATQMAETNVIKTSIYAATIPSQITQTYAASQKMASQPLATSTSAPAPSATEPPPADTALPQTAANTPSPAVTDTPTLAPTHAPVSISNCASENDWMVSPALRDSVFMTDSGCLDLSKLHITISDGLKIDFANEGARRTYNLYLSKKLSAPMKAAFTLKIQELLVLPKDEEDLSIYAGFVKGSNNEPDWLPPSYNEGKQGNFIFLRLPGTVVKDTGSQRTRFLLIDNNIHNFFHIGGDNILQIYNGTTQSIDIELDYRQDAILFSWKSEDQAEWKQRKSIDVPDPAYFVFGYSAPDKSKVNAWISNITIQPNEKE